MHSTSYLIFLSIDLTWSPWYLPFYSATSAWLNALVLLYLVSSSRILLSYSSVFYINSVGTRFISYRFLSRCFY